jgi:hypothetical protein
MTIPPSLDPLKSPWKRGDVCTRAFEKSGFVLNHTSEYLEVRWIDDESIERIPTLEVDNLLRVAHADSLTPDSQRTNLESLQAIETLDALKHAIAERMKTLTTDKEKEQADHLVRRIFSRGECEWDTRHATLLVLLLTGPQNVGVLFRVRERIHRVFCSIK